MVSVLRVSFICLLIYNGVLRLTGIRSCSQTGLHVTNMCSADNYISNFIYLDVHNSSLYYLQSCVCTVHVRFPGTIYFVPITTPHSDCGSEIRVSSYDGNQSHSFPCGGSATFSVKPDDKINITVHNLGGAVYDTSYCYVISLASDSGAGTAAFQISCPYIERKTTTSTTTTTSSNPSTTSSITSSASTQDVSTLTSTSTTSTKSDGISTTRYAGKNNDNEGDDVIIPLAIVVPLVLIGLIVTLVLLCRRNVFHRFFKKSKEDPCSNEDIVIDEGDGLKERSTEDLHKDYKSKTSSTMVRVTSATPIASRVNLRKSSSNKNIMILAPDPKMKDKENESDESTDVALQNKSKRTLDWRKSEADEGYFTEIHLGGGSKTIITVENLPRMQDDVQIRYDDIRTEL